ncbi:DUF4192 domain-containing protein [Streptosporangium sp. NPDC051022]|uniref:DUF4192 domain-containing protein n=1 Tax=Streptosporangium sp. NPDC051022 TaxID=3155752 RepID=UPI0034358136
MDSDKVHVSLDELADVIAVVPYLLGFHPTLSLVILVINPANGAVTATIRFDLPDSVTDGPELAQQLGCIVTGNEASHVLLIGYGPGRRVTPIMDAVCRVLHGRHIEIIEALRVEEGRYWSYLCPDPGCCPPEGTPFDITATKAAASAVMAGVGVLPNRDALVAMLSPASGSERVAMRTATLAAHARAAAMLADPSVTGETWYAEGQERIREALARTADGEELSHEQVAWLGVLLTMIVVRDITVTFIDTYPADVLFRLWSRITRLVEVAYVPAPATLAAMAAYFNGDGALARIATDRALPADPGYRMAGLLQFALDHGLPPQAIGQINTPDLPEQLAEQVREHAHVIRPVIHQLD